MEWEMRERDGVGNEGEESGARGERGGVREGWSGRERGGERRRGEV